MGLGLPAGGTGDFVLYIKYNARAGRWLSKVDGQDQDMEVTEMVAVMDLANIKTGQLKFAAGIAPEHRWDSTMGAGDAEPGDGFKRGFLVHMFSDKNIGGLREFSSNAGSVNEALNTLFDAYEAGMGANPGKLPVVKCTAVMPIEGKHGTNYSPTLEIISWTDKPEAMDGEDAPAPQAAAPAVPPPAPAPQPATQPATQQTGDAF